MNIVIPLGGVGERFRVEGFKQPKPLIRVFEKEILRYTIDHLSLQPEDDMFIFYNANLAKDGFVECMESWYPHIHCIEIQPTEGAAQTVLQGLQIAIETQQIDVSKPLVLMDGDAFYTVDVLDKLRNSSQRSKNAVFFTRNEEPAPIYSYIQMDANNRITDIKEKQKISHYANTGIYCFDSISEFIENCSTMIEHGIRFKGEYYTSCVIAEMLKQGIHFYSLEVPQGGMISLGTPKQVRDYIRQTAAFLFDLDGTLVKTDAIYFDVWSEILQEHNIVLTPEIFQKYIHGNSDSSVIKTLLPHCMSSLDKLSEEKDTLFLKYLEKLEIVVGVPEFLQLLYKKAHKIAIVTNCNRRTAEAILQKTGFNQWIDMLVIGAECKKPKPYPDPYKHAMDVFGIPAQRVFVFEDSKTGLLSGAGIEPCCIVGIETNYSAKELRQAGANISIPDFQSLSVETLMSYENSRIDKLTEFVKKTLQDPQSPTPYVKSVSWDTTKLKGGYISDVLALKANLHPTMKLNGSYVITNHALKGITTDNTLDLVIKLENQNDSNLSRMANNLGLYEREYYFYEAISKYVKINIPRFYGLVKNDAFENEGILLENLNDRCELGLALDTEPVNTSLVIIESCAKLHAQFWGIDLTKSFPQLKKNNDSLFRPKWGEYVRKQWPEFLSRWKFMLSKNQLNIAERIVYKFDYIQEYLSESNLTLTHGDVKSGNIFYEPTQKGGYIPYFIDWQYVGIGKGVQDLVFFMIESFKKETMNHMFDLFRQYYYVKLMEMGVKGYTQEDYNRDFAMAACYYPFFVAIWFGTTPEDDLIDKNFPYFFIQKLFDFLERPAVQQYV